MATRLNPCLNVPGTAAAAMRFDEQTPTGLTLMASDMPPGSEHRQSESITVSLSGDDADVLRRWWDALSEGGTVTMPLERQVWGDDVGALTDRFGVPWLGHIAGDAQG